MSFKSLYLLLVEVSVRTNLICNSDSFHIVDLRSRKLVRILNWALADLLIENGHVDGLLNGCLVGCSIEMFVSLISVLIPLYNVFKLVICVTN